MIAILGAAVLVTGCLVGGSAAAGRMWPALPEALSLPLLILAAVGAPHDPAARGRWWVAAALLGLPLLQLVPLPPEIWAGLPGRRAVAEAYLAAGSSRPWLPVSLTPAATERFWLALLPPVALFLAVPLLDAAMRRRLAHLAILIGLLSVLLGLGQIAGGPDSPLRFYSTASRSDAVGLFANRNHHATFLALLVVLAGGLYASGPRPAREHRPERWFPAFGKKTMRFKDAGHRPGSDIRGDALTERVWLVASGILLLLGIAASGSRAGLFLGGGACLAVALILAAGGGAAQRRRSVLIWGGIAALPLLVGLAVFGAATLRLQAEAVSDDLRWRIAQGTWRALVEVFPVGGGFGSFERLYARAARPDELLSAVVNNAHNDWLELVLEGGVPALLLLAFGLAWLLRATVSRKARGEAPFDRAALAALWLCALHATVDYPLRTMSVTLVLALVCGLRAARTVESRRMPASAQGRRSPASVGDGARRARSPRPEPGRAG